MYAVRSRRSKGVSIGVNLDPQKTCNFDCVYCEVVDRKAMARKAGRPPIAVEDVARELKEELSRWPTPETAARTGAETVRDVAFAGDGEPSTFPGFRPLASRLLDVRDAAGFEKAPLVLITNGSGLDRTEMRETHDLFATRGGVFWIKLDAGTEAFFRDVCRTAIPFSRVLANLAEAARRHPIVVQSMFFAKGGVAPPAAEIDAWAARLRDVVGGGGALARVQVYTVARETLEPGVDPLPAAGLETIAKAARRVLPRVPVETFP